MAWYNDVYNGLGDGLNWLGEQAFGEDGAYKGAQDRADKQLDSGGAYVGKGGYTGQWAALLEQLRRQAQGTGPSVAESQYRQANQDQSAAIGGLARASGRPGAIRSAMEQQQRLGQGLAQGSSLARLQEQLAGQQAYSGALGVASNQDLQRQLANSQAYQNILQARLGQQQQPTALQRYANMASQGGAFAGKVAG
jgi:non-canonical (house-cleaning) NTP pyrophosphatase